jgi:hypothetical protein
VPPGADAYVQQFILQDWDDDDCKHILTNCRRAMLKHSKLLIIERMLAPPNEDLEGNFPTST